jgi:CubicO group peptidase (beta-lactamase class C family)
MTPLHHLRPLLVPLTAIVITLLAISLTAFRRHSPPLQPHSSVTLFSTYLDQRIPELMDRYEVPGVAIALLREGKTVWSQAYGYARPGQSMSTATRCRVESISKPVTAWGVMKLVERGRLALDTPVQQYLESWAFPPGAKGADKITVRQLLSHSAGLSLGTIGVRYTPGEPLPSLRDYLTGEVHMIAEPGTTFSYSNTGYNLLEVLIEDVTGGDYATFMQAEVLQPLGMQGASFTWSAGWQPPLPDGHDLEGCPVPVYVYPARGAGGLFATVDDIASFVAAGMNRTSGGGVLSPQTIRQLYTPEVEVPGFYGLAYDHYGLGHFIETLPSGERAVAHGGQGTGWMTHFEAVPRTGDGIVLLTNSQRSWPFFALLLRDWGEWNGLGAPGMSKLSGAEKALYVLMGMVFLLSVGQAGRLAYDLVRSTRWWAPLTGAHRYRRIAMGVTGTSLLALLLWAANQPYLAITSLFPAVCDGLSATGLLAAVVLLATALLPREQQDVPAVL